jgi:hypothetical protein|eukprot:6688778-Prymnesium_polylepis.2
MSLARTRARAPRICNSAHTEHSGVPPVQAATDMERYPWALALQVPGSVPTSLQHADCMLVRPEAYRRHVR